MSAMAIFWSVLAVLYLFLSYFTWKARQALIKDLGKSEDLSDSGIRKLGKNVVIIPPYTKR